MSATGEANLINGSAKLPKQSADIATGSDGIVTRLDFIIKYSAKLITESLDIAPKSGSITKR